MRMFTPYLSTQRLASDLFDEMDRLFDEWNRELPSRAPACEVAESDEHYLMSVDLPGVKKEDLKIETADGMLTIAAERKREGGASAVFRRSFALPSSVEADRAEARYENGVLELYLPKTAAAKPRRIEIQSGATGGGFFERLLGGGKKQDLKDVTSSTRAS